MKVKNNLQKLMDSQNLTLRKIAEATNGDHSTIWKMAKNESNPPASRLIALADFFDCSVDYLLCRTEQKLIADKITPDIIRQQLEDAENISKVKKETIKLIKQMEDSSVENIRDICKKIVEASENLKEERKKYYGTY